MELSYYVEDGASDVVEFLDIILVQPGPTVLRTIASFHPKHLYYNGEEGDEMIIANLRSRKSTISLFYDASTMRPNLVFKDPSDAAAASIPHMFRDCLPPEAFQTYSEFKKAITAAASAADEDDAGFQPPGERISTFSGSDGRYEVWRGSLADPAVFQLMRRVQALVMFFIEDGMLIDTYDVPLDRWTLFFLYQTRQRPGAADRYEYVFAGYSTVFRYLLPVGPATPPPSTDTSKDDAELELPSADSGFDLTTLPCRSRISQFLVLPPFQGHGNGGHLYRTIFDQFVAEPQTLEITVEDPNEAFDDMRDLADLAYLSSLPAFTDAVRINTAVQIPHVGPAPRDIVDPAVLDTMRRQAKMSQRQFNRVVEMYLMQKLAPALRPSLDHEEDDDEAGGDGKGKGAQKAAPPPPPPPPPVTKEQQHEYKLWRLFVKQRLYRHNMEILAQLERSQRIEKLEETLLSVELDYARLLSKYESRAKLGGPAAAEASAPQTHLAAPETALSPAASTSSKRKSEDDGSEVEAKKARV